MDNLMPKMIIPLGFHNKLVAMESLSNSYGYRGEKAEF
jgi:hypothetical protein